MEEWRLWGRFQKPRVQKHCLLNTCQMLAASPGLWRQGRPNGTNLEICLGDYQFLSLFTTLWSSQTEESDLPSPPLVPLASVHPVCTAGPETNPSIDVRNAGAGIGLWNHFADKLVDLGIHCYVSLQTPVATSCYHSLLSPGHNVLHHYPSLVQCFRQTGRQPVTWKFYTFFRAKKGGKGSLSDGGNEAKSTEEGDIKTGSAP